ncbi:MAG TPA: hypothetical protein VGF87_07160 [Acidimicrobiales bacterium]
MSTRAMRALLLAVATVLTTIGEGLAWLLVRSQGVDLGGDQAHYLIAGQAVSHLSFNPLPEYQRDFLTHFIYRWPPNATIANFDNVQTYPGPHGAVFAHGLGLPILLSPFLRIGSVPLALVGLFAMNAAGFVCLHQRASLLAGLRRNGQIVFGLVLAAPALWLASTQVYPDLLSGILLAMALVEMALIEQRKRTSPFSAVVIAGALALVPWLQIKNLAPAVLCVLALGALARRNRPDRKPLLLAGAVIVVVWVLLAVYNQYYFHNLSGLPQPHPTFTVTTAGRTLALIFDGHQGLLVQVPTVLIGVVGLWLGRRIMPWTAAAAALGVVAMLLINGTYTTTVPFGGTALAGRFQWTMLPMLLVWSPFALAAMEHLRARLVAVGTVVAALWVAQGVPILIGDHTYFNALFGASSPWDPSTYPGWWPFVGGLFPTFLVPGLHLAATWTHLLVLALLAAGAAWVVLLLTRSGRRLVSPALAGVAALVIAAVVVLAVGPSRTEPSSLLAISPAQAAAPWTSTAFPADFAPAALATVGPGTYRLTMTYAGVPGSGRAIARLETTTIGHLVVSGWLTLHHPTDAAFLTVASPPLGPVLERSTPLALHALGHQVRAALVLTVDQQSLLSLQVSEGAHSSFAASSLVLTKLSS